MTGFQNRIKDSIRLQSAWLLGQLRREEAQLPERHPLRESISLYKGGQMEIFDSYNERYYRGEISTISLGRNINGDNELRVQFAWLARADSAYYASFPSVKWIKEDEPTGCNIRLRSYDMSPIFDDGSISMHSSLAAVSLTLHQRGGSRIERPSL